MIESYEGEVVVAEMVYRDWENRASSRFLFRLTALGCAVDEELRSLDECNNPKVCQIHLIYASMSLILPKSTIDPCAIVILWFPRCIICRWYRLPKIPNDTIRKLRNPQIKLRYKWLRKSRELGTHLQWAERRAIPYRLRCLGKLRAVAPETFDPP